MPTPPPAGQSERLFQLVPAIPACITPTLLVVSMPIQRFLFVSVCPRSDNCALPILFAKASASLETIATPPLTYSREPAPTGPIPSRPLALSHVKLADPPK